MDEGRTEVKQYTPPTVERGYKNSNGCVIGYIANLIKSEMVKQNSLNHKSKISDGKSINSIIVSPKT